jgi:hypothetical protein
MTCILDLIVVTCGYKIILWKIKMPQKYYDLQEQNGNIDAQNQKNESEDNIPLMARLYCYEKFLPLEEWIGEISDNSPNNDSTMANRLIDYSDNEEENLAIASNAESSAFSADATVVGITEENRSKESQEILPLREAICSLVEAGLDKFLDKEGADVLLIGDNNVPSVAENVE